MKMKGTGKCSGDGCEVMRVEGGDDDDVAQIYAHILSSSHDDPNSKILSSHHTRTHIL